MGIFILILLLVTTLLGIFREKLEKEENHTRFDVLIKKHHLTRIDVAMIFICVVCTGLQIGDLVSQNNKGNKEKIVNASNVKKQFEYQDSLRKNIDSLKSSNYNLIQINEIQRTSIDAQSELIRQLQNQAKGLDELGRRQLHLVEYMQELNHEVRAVYFRLKLNKEYSFEEICPLKLGFEFRPSEDSPLKFRKLVTNADRRTRIGNKDVPLVGYFISDVSFNDSATITNNFTLGRLRNTKLQNILIPVEFTEDITDAVKEFHDENFFVYLQNSLINKIDSIQLIVNGWVILDESPHNVFWGKSFVGEWLSLKNKEITLDRPMTDPHGKTPPIILWRISVYNKLPGYYESAASRLFPPSLIKSRKFYLY